MPRRSHPRAKGAVRFLAIGLLASLGTFGTSVAFPETDVPDSLVFWIGFFGAHDVMLVTVRRIADLRTDAARWFAMSGFAAYLALLIFAYAYIFSVIGLKDGATVGETHDIWTCVFFSVTTWTTVGFGDVTAVRTAARFFAAMEALNGFVVVALFVAALVPFFQALMGGPTDHRSPGMPDDSQQP